MTNTSKCTDNQARRGIVSVLENFQQADGTVKIPAALVPYVGFEVIKRK